MKKNEHVYVACFLVQKKTFGIKQILYVLFLNCKYVQVYHLRAILTKEKKTLEALKKNRKFRELDVELPQGIDVYTR